MTQIISVPVLPCDVELARSFLRERPVYRGSHRGASANEVGCLGEAVAYRVLTGKRVPMAPVFTTTHDFTVADKWTLEVKTKDRTVAPLPSYECSVPAYVADHQTADFFVFVSLQRNRSLPTALENFTRAHVVGVSTREMLTAKSMLRQTGEVDPANGVQFWTACYNLRISDLQGMMSAIAQWNRLSTEDGVNA